MPCDSCGHSKAAHRELTVGMFFCSQCQKVESNIAFPPDRKAESTSMPDDLLSQLYYSHQAFRR